MQKGKISLLLRVFAVKKRLFQRIVFLTAEAQRSRENNAERQNLSASLRLCGEKGIISVNLATRVILTGLGVYTSDGFALPSTSRFLNRAVAKRNPTLALVSHSMRAPFLVLRNMVPTSPMPRKHAFRLQCHLATTLTYPLKMN